MDFPSNSIVTKIPNFLDLRLSPANIADKLKSIMGLATRFEGLTYRSDSLVSRHSIEEVNVRRVSEKKSYSDYIKHSEFETTFLSGKIYL